MERHPSILELTPYLVHKKDSYSFHNGAMVHEYDPFDDSRSIETFSDIAGGYVKIEYVDGRPPKYFTATAKYIQKCAGCAQTQNVWKKWFEQQALKTVIRACYARRAVPIDPFADKALKLLTEREDAIMGNDPNRPVVHQRPQSVDAFKAKARPAPPQSEIIDVVVEQDDPEPPQEPPTPPVTSAEPKQAQSDPDEPPTPEEVAQVFIAKIGKRRSKGGIDEDLEAAMKEIHGLPADDEDKHAAQTMVIEAADKRTDEVSGKNPNDLFNE